jgi:hypothetical protein
MIEKGKSGEPLGLAIDNGIGPMANERPVATGMRR